MARGSADADTTVAVGDFETEAPPDAPTAPIEIARRQPQSGVRVVGAVRNTVLWQQVSWAEEMPSTPRWRNPEINLGTHFRSNGTLHYWPSSLVLV